MVDLAFGPEPGPRRDTSTAPGGYLEMQRRKRLFGGILLLVFVLMMAAGWRVAEERNAGGFLNGLAQLDDFPREVLSEAWDKREAIPGGCCNICPR